VTVFKGNTVIGLLRETRPQIYAKGGDYTIDSLNQEELVVVREIKADVKILSLVPGKSTTAVFEKMEPGEYGEKE